MRIGIVGAGNGGTALLRALHGLAGMTIAVVVDPSSESPGVALAKEWGIPWETSIENMDKHRIEAVLEATGVQSVKEKLDTLYGGSKNIIHSEAARIMMSVVDQHAIIHHQLESQLKTISRATQVFTGEFGSLSETVRTLEGVGDSLTDSVRKSSEYIKKSDELSKSVNQIAAQIKILGINANIEAARAGDAGRGFSVVASEVQKLSDSSTQFATEISEMLKNLSEELEAITIRVKTLNDVSKRQTHTEHALKNELENLCDTVTQ